MDLTIKSSVCGVCRKPLEGSTVRAIIELGGQRLDVPLHTSCARIQDQKTGEWRPANASDMVEYLGWTHKFSMGCSAKEAK